MLRRLKKVLCGLLWEEVRRVRRVALVWNGSPERRPKADEVAVTFFDAEAQGTIPTWWNETVLREADKTGGVRRRADVHLCHPVGHVWSGRQCARRAGGLGLRSSHGPGVHAGRWKRMDLEIEWGFDKSTAALDLQRTDRGV